MLCVLPPPLLVRSHLCLSLSFSTRISGDQRWSHWSRGIGRGGNVTLHRYVSNYQPPVVVKNVRRIDTKFLHWSITRRCENTSFFLLSILRSFPVHLCCSYWKFDWIHQSLSQGFFFLALGRSGLDAAWCIGAGRFTQSARSLSNRRRRKDSLVFFCSPPPFSLSLEEMFPERLRKWQTLTESNFPT